MIVGPFRALTSEYSEAIKVYYPFSVRLHSQWLGRGSKTLEPIDKWCEERFGLTAKHRDTEWADDGEFMTIYYTLDLGKFWLRRIGTFHFQDENHAFEFKLRWG